MRRMQAMEKSTNLGEGVMLARQDMEIRGIGEVLGEEQSGHIHSIGFTLYMRLLEQAIKAIDNGETKVDTVVLLGQVQMPLVGKIPSSFMPASGDRLAWYQRFMSSETPDELEMNFHELRDMYGYLPAELDVLKDSVLKHLAANVWGISSIKEVGGAVQIEAHKSANVGDLHAMLALSFLGRMEVSEKPRTFLIKKSDVDGVSSTIFKNTAF